MADAPAGILSRLQMLAGYVYEKVDIVDLWFLSWVGLSLFGMLVVRVITSFTFGKAVDNSSPQYRSARTSNGLGASTTGSANSNDEARNGEADGGEPCAWLNALISWLANGATGSTAGIKSLVSVWLVSLNETVRDTKGTSQQVAFERIVSGGLPPTLSDVRVRSSSAKSIVFTASVRAADTSLRVTCGRRFAEQPYLLNLLHLDGSVRIELAQVDSQLSVTVQFVSAPVLKLEVQPVESQLQGTRSAAESAQIEQQRVWLESRVTRAIQDCVLKLNLNTAIASNRFAAGNSSQPSASSYASNATLTPTPTPASVKPSPSPLPAVEPEVVAKSVRSQAFAAPPNSNSDSSSLKAAGAAAAAAASASGTEKQKASAGLNGSAKSGSFSKSLPGWNSASSRAATDRRLLLKVVKASGLGAREFGCRSAHCVATVDEPAQRHQTPSVRGTVNPFWDAHFLFDLNAQSSKLTFEIFDDDEVTRGNSNASHFLGQAVLSLDILHDVPSSRQMLPLRSRPGMPDNSTGTITVELLVLEHTELDALPITAQAHEYTLPKTPVDGKSVARESRAEIGNGKSNGVTPANATAAADAGAPRRIIVETSRLETARGDIITTVTMEEKAPGDDAPPPVPQRTSSLADTKQKTAAVADVNVKVGSDAVDVRAAEMGEDDDDLFSVTPTQSISVSPSISSSLSPRLNMLVRTDLQSQTQTQPVATGVGVEESIERQEAAKIVYSQPAKLKKASGDGVATSSIGTADDTALAGAAEKKKSKVKTKGRRIAGRRKKLETATQKDTDADVQIGDCDNAGYTSIVDSRPGASTSGGNALNSSEAASPKRGSRPLKSLSLFGRKGNASEKGKQKERYDSQSPGAQKKSGKKQQKEGKTRSKDLEQATLQNNEDSEGSLKRSKSSGLSSSFRRVFGSSIRDRSKPNASTSSSGNKNALESPS